SSEGSTPCTARLGSGDGRVRSAQGSGAAITGAVGCCTGTDRCFIGAASPGVCTGTGTGTTTSSGTATAPSIGTDTTTATGTTSGTITGTGGTGSRSPGTSPSTYGGTGQIYG
ncbi:hypothetical protein KI387_004365, partial [Taxus chinensis]